MENKIKNDDIRIAYSKNYSELAVEYTKPRKGKNGYTVRGSAVNARTYEPYDIAPYSKTVPRQNISTARARIMFTLEERYLKIIEGTQKANVEEETIVFLDELADMAKDGYRLTPTWTAEETNYKAIIYFEKHTLLFVKPFINGERKEFLPSDASELRKALMDDVKKSKKTLNENSINNTVNRHMTEAALIFNILYNNVDGFPCCQIPNEFITISSPSNEPPKFIPPNKIMALCELLLKSVNQYPKEVIATVMMLYGGRTSESAAVKACDITDKGTYLDVPIFCQEKNGKRVPKLKKEVSRRVMIIGDFGRYILLEALKFLTDDEKSDMSDSTYITASSLNQWIMNTFRMCGISSRFDDVHEHDETEDVSSYILRRNFAGMARNWMGLSFGEVNAQLGHIGACEMRDADRRAEVAMKMSRFPFSDEVQNIPWNKPIELNGMTSCGVEKFTGYKFTNSTLLPLSVSIDIVACENNAEIELGGVKKQRVDVKRMSEFTEWEHRHRNIKGDSISLLGNKWKREDVAKK